MNSTARFPIRTAHKERAPFVCLEGSFKERGARFPTDEVDVGDAVVFDGVELLDPVLDVHGVARHVVHDVARDEGALGAVEHHRLEVRGVDAAVLEKGAAAVVDL